MNYADFLNAGYRDEPMGDITDSLFELAQGFLPGSFLAPVGDALAGAASGSIPTPFVDPSDGGSSSAKVTAPNGVKLRAQPNENSTMKSLLSYGTPLSVIKTGLPSTPAAPKGWTQVRTESGAEGYVTTEWLSISSPTSASSGNTSSSSLSSAIVPKPSTTPASSSIFDNKLLLVGGGVAAVVVIGAVLLGGKKKKAA
jgi:hypothetical protein